ncbi:protein kinase [Streptomyces sp. NPDC088757]|uniref:protein kinase domain-containing protein n=1 Tax=Streptomyces sp. NPDC088757 TaxID=3365889 RepID=UPI0038231630
MTVIAGRYRLLDVLAEGATGTVWRALDETNGHEVALKESRVPPGLPADEVPLLHARRERGARAAARISHPSVVRVLGVVTDDGRPWVATELVRGLTLAETLEAGGPLPAREAARVGAEVLAGLRAAREAGVPHRGVAPEDVLLGNDGRVVVTGFGGAPRTKAEEAGPAEELRSLGALLGTIADDRSGPLGTVVDALLGEGPGGVPTAERAERELRRVAGGGARTPTGGSRSDGSGARTGRSGARADGDGARAGGGAPKAGASPADAPATHRSAHGHGTAPASGMPGTSGTSGTSGTPSARRTKTPRRVPVLVAGIVGALLIAGALIYHAVRDDGPGAGPGAPGGVTSTVPAGSGATGAGGVPATPRS